MELGVGRGPADLVGAARQAEVTHAPLPTLAAPLAGLRGGGAAHEQQPGAHVDAGHEAADVEGVDNRRAGVGDLHEAAVGEQA